MVKNYIKKQIERLDIELIDPELLATSIHALILLIFCILVYWIARNIVLRTVHKIAAKTKTHWDDKLVEAHFFRRAVLLLPLIIIRLSVNSILKEYDTSVEHFHMAFEILIIIAISRILIAFINALQAILQETPNLKDKPLQSYSQLLKIIVYITIGILIFSIVTGRTPMFFITAMGAMSAIVLLIFKDTILGFIGSIQLASNDMVRVGDWISMEKYGADGNVIEINLATIKVRNWDLTITTIPTYALVSDSFKNWRGMQESEGRRIKRAVHIKTDSISFCSNEQIEKFRGMRLLKDYIDKKEHELEEYNNKLGLKDSKQVNGRSLTNIGVFRKYVELYLQENPNITKDLTCMVRQLQPNEKGLPIEVYAFSNDKTWENYEAIMADIFDHLLAIIPEFDLEVFQNPTGKDFKSFNKK